MIPWGTNTVADDIQALFPLTWLLCIYLTSKLGFLWLNGMTRSWLLSTAPPRLSLLSIIQSPECQCPQSPLSSTCWPRVTFSPWFPPRALPLAHICAKSQAHTYVPPRHLCLHVP